MTIDVAEGDPQDEAPQAQAPPQRPDDAALRAIVTRLSRPHRSGGRVVERAALMAAGMDFGLLLEWVESHGGEAEALPEPSARGTGYADLRDERRTQQQPLRFVLPADAFA